MSFLQGKKNLYSLITNRIIDNIRKKKTMNDKLKNMYNNNILKVTDNPDNGSVIFGTPTNLVTETSINLECGDEIQCKNCIINNSNMSVDDLSPSNYTKNISQINNLRDNECFGVCSCKLSYINLSTDLVFATGININGQDIDNQEISKNVVNDITSANKTDSQSSTHPSWYWALCGLPGALYAATSTSYNDIEKNVNQSVSNISLLFINSINQLISSSQSITIKGSGIKVHNISLKSIQDIVMTASQSNCSPNGATIPSTCVSTSIENLTNSLLDKMTGEMTQSAQSMFSYAFKQNSTLIYGSIVFIAGSLILYLYLIIKRSLKN